MSQENEDIVVFVFFLRVPYGKDDSGAGGKPHLIRRRTGSQ
jgi:hypothetical protein